MEKIKELNIVNQENYYIPTIDEFYVGFEYEVLVKDIKEGITKWVHKYNPFTIQNLELFIENNRVRVKYLDQEDIESLGFEYDKTSTNSQLKFFKDNVCLYYRPQTHEVGTFTIDPFKNEYMMKHIMDNKQTRILTIKNKSELRKLMKQLNIND